MAIVTVRTEVLIHGDPDCMCSHSLPTYLPVLYVSTNAPNLATILLLLALPTTRQPTRPPASRCPPMSIEYVIVAVGKHQVESLS
jgi:hypothetical protein